VFGTALNGRSKERQELADAALDLEALIATVPCRGGELGVSLQPAVLLLASKMSGVDPAAGQCIETRGININRGVHVSGDPSVESIAFECTPRRRTSRHVQSGSPVWTSIGDPHRSSKRVQTGEFHGLPALYAVICCYGMIPLITSVPLARQNSDDIGRGKSADPVVARDWVYCMEIPQFRGR
jgi:RNA repair, ligase-Pnkp-associating, region of Hen1